MSGSQLTDSHHRRLNYLRVSVTDRCNFRCIYCTPAEKVPRLAHDDILRYEEIYRILRVGMSLGINKVRVTGGEPLVRQGIGKFLERLARMEGLSDVSLTTNGLRLSGFLDTLRAAGIRRLNISLDTLRPDRFKAITGVDAFETVWNAIQGAHKHGFAPIKINAVAMRGINDDELEEIASLSFTHPFHIRFIEYMPIGTLRFKTDPYISTDEIRRRVGGIGQLIPVEHSPGDGPAERYRFPGAKGEIGFISPISHHFCGTCNRLRLTASGGLRACLLSDKETDLKTLIRAGGSDASIRRVFEEVARAKPERHGISAACHLGPQSRMSAIGG
ncbi:MAG: GTP 3',8-cyclase MoaA [Desulfobacterales bacterium]